MGIQPPEAVEPHNAVLRGGPLDGETLTVRTIRVPVDREVDGRVYRYAPTAEVDDEYPTMVVFTFVA